MAFLSTKNWMKQNSNDLILTLDGQAVQELI